MNYIDYIQTLNSEELQDEAFKWWSKCIERVSNKREPFMRFADYYFKKNMHAQVIQYCEAALTIKQVPFYSNWQPYYENYPHELLYISYWWSGDKAKSKEHHDKAIEWCPTNARYISDRQFYYSFPSVSIVIPSMRKEGLQRCLDSIKNLNYPIDKVQFMVKEGEGTVPQKVKEMLEQSTGEYVVYAADDMEFTPDSIFIAVQESINLNKKLVSFNAGHLLEDNGNICEHFLIKKDIIKDIGGMIFDTDFHHVGVDNLLWAQCDKLGQAYHSENAIIIHNHFSKGSAFDDVYQEGWKNVEEDRATLKIKLKELYERGQ